jgi:hypothetical protein
MKCKKSQTSNVATLIIFLVVIIILFPAFSKIYQKIFLTSSDEICKISVMKHSGINQVTGDLKSSSIDCPRKNLVFKDNEVLLDKKAVYVYETVGDDKKTKKISTTKEYDYIVNQVLANEIYKCWNKMGAGEYDVFEKDLSLTTDYVCLICNQFSFDVGKTNQNYKGIVDYLENYYIPQENNNVTYLEYISKQQPTYLTIFGQHLPWTHHIMSSDPKALINTEIEYNSEKTYAIYFYGYKPNKINTDVFKAQTDAYYVIISKVQDMTNKCGYIYN